MKDVSGKAYDVTVIGAGPVGLFAVYYAGLRDMRVKVIDSLPQLGGQLGTLYPEKLIYDVPGLPKVVASDLVESLGEQARQFEPAICLREKVLHLRREDNDEITLVTDKDDHVTRTAIVACGVGAFVPRKLDIQSINKLEGRGVHYFVHSKKLFERKRLLIVGGGDSAVDWALELEHVAEAVTLVHKFDRWQAHENSVARLLNSSVRVMPRWELQEVHGEDHVQEVTIVNNVDGRTERFPIEHLLLNIGFVTNLGPIKEWGLEIEGNAIKVNSQMETNLPGVYAAGDIVTYPGKLKLIATGTGEAAIAANNAKTRLSPGARFYPGHSSQRDDLHQPAPKPGSTGASLP